MKWRATNQGVFCFSTASSRMLLLALPPPPTRTVYSNSKSNMAGRINDCKLMTLARIHTTPALQGKAEIDVNIHSLENKFELNAWVWRHYSLIQCEKNYVLSFNSMKLRLLREAVTSMTISLDCTETEGNGIYDTVLSNWGTNSELSLG